MFLHIFFEWFSYLTYGNMFQPVLIVNWLYF